MIGAVSGPVAVLPAWETLPFERVSPEVETMGRRLALLWGLTHGEDDAVDASAATRGRGADPGPAAAAGAAAADERGADGGAPRSGELRPTS